MHTKRRQNTMNGGGNSNGQHRHPNNNNRPRRFNNNRPQGEGGNDPANVARTRRNATQSKEKYQMMARDAMQAGDRVQAEYYLQHADHYHRILLSLPPEEIRPQYQPRNYTQHTGDQQAPHADGQQGDAAPSHADNGYASNGNGMHSHATPAPQHQDAPAAPALPAFITQTQPPEEQ